MTEAQPTVIRKDLIEALDVASLGVSTYTDLRALFEAIQTGTKLSHVQELAKIGRYLAEDWRDTFIGQLESFSDHMEEQS